MSLLKISQKCCFKIFILKRMGYVMILLQENHNVPHPFHIEMDGVRYDFLEVKFYFF